MDTIAAVTTAKGMAAISLIELAGSKSEAIIREVFKPLGKSPLKLTSSSILTGTITDGQNTIDHVVLAITESNGFEIGCHGNPLIVEKIMNLLVSKGATAVSADQFRLQQLLHDPSKNTVETEATLQAAKAATLQGAKLITNQPGKGLGKLAENWLKDFDNIPLDDIKTKCTEVLATSKIAKLITQRVKIIIAGAPNSGKSTLLNTLAGKQKAIVTDIAGTTRDWVSTTLRTDSLMLEFFDTAGLDANLTCQSRVDTESQRLAMNLALEADLVLLLIDPTATTDTADLKFPKDKKVIAVFNKSDITPPPADIDIDADAAVSISAKNADNIDALIEKIITVLGVNKLDIARPVCFTPRQHSLLQRLIGASDKPAAKTLISELLNGDISV